MSNLEPGPDAQPSNSGDRFHFVYGARRMLDMLHPGSGLDLLVMEGVAEEDRVFAEGRETFLGVDLTEYYGGSTVLTADRTVIVQLKYSALHPDQHWTLRRLLQDRTTKAGNQRPGTSVLRKLANAFQAVYRARQGEVAGRVVIRLQTNQPLDDDLRAELLQLRAVADSASGTTAAGRALRMVGNPLAERLQAATGLSWVQLAGFLLVWDLDGFGQAMLSSAEADLFAEVDRFTDGGVMVGNLIAFVQEHAQAHRRTDITRKQVYHLLRLREEDFFPAPSPLDGITDLFITQDAAALLKDIHEERESFLLVEGRGGSGKSSALRVAAREYGGGGFTVLYDCYAGGAGLSAGTERYPYKICFTQIINELDARFRTGILVTTRLPYTTLMRRLTEALTAAARTASSLGGRLVIAIDAVDNAVDVAERSPVRTEESFVPLLWRIQWPDNCLVVLTARSENVHRIGLPANVSCVEITGFNQAETERHVRIVLPQALETVPSLVQALQEGTRGNPRVQAAILEDIALQGVANPLEFVRDRARQSAFEYYAAECPRRLTLSTDRLLLAVLREATQFLPLGVLAGVLGRPKSDVEAVIRSLSFGLRLTDLEEITWRDQEFLDFVSDFVAPEQHDARIVLADYCVANRDRSSYARQNAARHLHQADRHEELLRWCLAEGHLEKRMREVEPHGEDVLEEIEYALRSAITLSRTVAALSLLALAAEILQGRDLFVEKLWDALPAAIASGYLGRLLDEVSDDLDAEDAARLYVSLANALARAGRELDLARDLVERGIAALNQAARREGSRTLFDQRDDAELASAIRYLRGFTPALERMQRWQPRSAVAPTYAAVARTWRVADEPDPVTAIRRTVPEDEARLYAFAGLLAAETPLPSDIAEDATSEILSSPATVPLPQTALRRALFGLLKSGHLDLARRLLPRSQPRAPSYATDSGLAEFLDERALSVALGVDAFDPSSYGELGPDEKGDREADRVKELRVALQRHYPARLAFARSLVGAPPEVIKGEIEAALQAWKRSYDYPGQLVHTTAREPGDLLAEAVLRLGGNHIELVELLLDVTGKVTGDPLVSYSRYASIFAADPRYQVVAERLILKIRLEYRPPRCRAQERVEVLLELHGAASLFDPELASALFVDARLTATELDAEIPGRAAAMLRTLSASAAQGVSDEALVDLARIYAYMKQAEGGESSVPRRELLQVLATTRPGVAFWTAGFWDDQDVLWMRDAVGPLAHGLLEVGHVDSGAVWPLLGMCSSWNEAAALYRQAIEQMISAKHDPSAALAAYGRFARARVARDSRPRAAMQMADWASSVGIEMHPEVARVRSYGEALVGIGIGEQEWQPRDYQREFPTLYVAVKEAIGRSAHEAADVLQFASEHDLRELTTNDLEDLLTSIRPLLTSARLIDLLEVIERWDEVHDYPGGVELTLGFLGLTPADRLTLAARPVIQRLLTPRVIAHLASRNTRERPGLSLRHPIFAGPEGFAVLMTATARHLRSLSAEELHRWIGTVSELLAPEDAGQLFLDLLGRARDRLPTPLPSTLTRPWEAPAPHVRFLCDLLGHPRTDMRWHAVYALADLCLAGPPETLGSVAREMGDTSHPRWMTKREWLAFLLEHLALRRPEALTDVVPDVLAGATDDSFPHAKIRHHLREALLRVEAARPGTLPAEAVDLLRLINQPRSLSEERRRHRSHGRMWEDDRDRPFSFDEMDTLRYWYDPLNECFLNPQRTAEEIAYEWIASRWGITDDLCRRDAQENRFDWRETGHSHGSLPRVETLRTYVERHGLYLAAGELITSAMVVFEGEREGDLWTEWARSHLRQADPAIPGRFVDAPPPVPENYGRFALGFDEWRRKDEEAEFQAELHPDGAVEWLVVAEARSGGFRERRFRAEVWSALVSEESADALRRAAFMEDDDVPLPSVRLSYGTTWPEYERDLEQRSDYYVYTDNEIAESETGCELRCWLTDFHQEFEFDGADPWMESRSRNWAAFTPDVVRDLELTRAPSELCWNDSDGRKAAYLEVWDDATSCTESAETADGYRLMLRADLASRLARKRGMSILLQVELARNQSSRSRGRTEEKVPFDTGTHRMYVFDGNGTIR